MDINNSEIFISLSNNKFARLKVEILKENQYAIFISLNFQEVVQLHTPFMLFQIFHKWEVLLIQE